MLQVAPDVFTVAWSTSVKGSAQITVNVNRSWAPHGSDRFYNLARLGFFNFTRFFRVVPGFVVQFGLSGDPRIAEQYCDDYKCPASSQSAKAPILPDLVRKSNTRGYLSYSLMDGGVNASTEMFINLANNSRLDQVVDTQHQKNGSCSNNGTGHLFAFVRGFTNDALPRLLLFLLL
jgi:peptidyl-prolyl cis-trans isomerase A (cyclophilin A)